MKIIYLDCYSGVSGDMCLGALVDAGVPLEVVRSALAGLPIDGYELRSSSVHRGGIAATKVDVVRDDQGHPPRGLDDVLEIIHGGDLSPDVQERSSAVFRRLAEAEARVHGTDPNSIHFHEVGAVDAICDIVGTVAGLDHLGADKICFSRISLGGGTVEAAHGTLPVPAPATVRLLEGLPASGGPVDMELTTPTGAALISTLGEAVPDWPQMQIETVGYGAGSRELEVIPNALRLAIGEAPSKAEDESDYVWCLETNLDDMTGEEVGYCCRRLLEGDALDVYTTSVQMKKDRPGVKVTVLCAPEDLHNCEQTLFQDTATLGIRRALLQRSKLSRSIVRVETPWGEARGKVAGGAVVEQRFQPEYEDCARIARDNGLPLRRVYDEVRRAWEEADARRVTGQ